MSGDEAARHSLHASLVGHADPQVRMIAELMTQQQAAVQKADAEQRPGAAETVDVVVDLEASERQRRRRIKLRHFAEELEFQREIGDTLAAALGACYLCWGEDSRCRRCGGHGTPGWSVPDSKLFREYVEPAVTRLQEVGESGPSAGERPSSPNQTPTDRSP